MDGVATGSGCMLLPAHRHNLILK
ncbi:uncharacterized protein METZ01_LOCUS153435 [marine metagenome]|uniref:Uncharacterized protein n=1 Tax=marine metagenome TaxID=408172 RepID=A0A382AH33_9ZZZZ